MLGASLAIGCALMSTRSYANLGRDTIGAVLFAANIVFWRDVDYFGPVAIEQPLLHLWSLGVEEQFYLVWPVILILAWRYRWPRVRIAAALAIISFGYGLWLSVTDPPAAFYLPFDRAWELMLGALLALTRPALPRAAGHVASVVGLLLLPAAAAGGGRAADRGGRPLSRLARADAVRGGGAVDRGGSASAGQPLCSFAARIGLDRADQLSALSVALAMLSFATNADFGDVPCKRMRAGLVVAAFALAAATYLLIKRPAPIRRMFPPHRGAFLMALIGVASIWCLVGAPARTTSRNRANAFIDRYENLRLHGLAEAYRFEYDFYDAEARNAHPPRRRLPRAGD